MPALSRPTAATILGRAATREDVRLTPALGHGIEADPSVAIWIVDPARGRGLARADDGPAMQCRNRVKWRQVSRDGGLASVNEPPHVSPGWRRLCRRLRAISGNGGVDASMSGGA